MIKGIDYIGVSVGALIVNDKGEIFLSKRSINTRNQQGCWETPGGAVDFGEKRENAIKREIKEEFGVDIEIIKPFQTVDEILPKEKQHWVATIFLAKIIGNKKPKIMEPRKCDAIGWFSINNLPTPLSYVTTLDTKAYREYLKSDNRQIRKKHLAKNKKITICSSASFYKDVLKIEKKLKRVGFKVKIPKTAYRMRMNKNFKVEDYKTWFRDKNDYKKKTKLMNEHFKKVIEADVILVVNNKKNGIQGYIGANTLMEMALAYYFKKKIFVWNDVGSNFQIEEEVRGLNPIFINQDLSKIKL